MFNDPLFIVVAVACVSVLIILLIGIGGFAKGGDFNRKYANKIMRLRLVTQAIAIVLIAIYIYRRQGGL